MKRIIATDAPVAIGPYSHAMQANKFVFVSGQLPVDPGTGEMPEGIEEQARASCENVEAVLRAAGTDSAHVLKTTCYLADMADFQAFNKIYGEHFAVRPARSCVAVRELPKGALCEIEAIAIAEERLS